MAECVSLLPFEMSKWIWCFCSGCLTTSEKSAFTSLPFEKIGLSRILPSNLALFSVTSNNNNLSVSSTKWSNKLRQFVGNSRMLSVFDYFVWLALKGLNFLKTEKPYFWHFWNNFFPQKQASSVFRYYNYLESYKISEKTIEPLLRQCVSNVRTDGRT